MSNDSLEFEDVLVELIQSEMAKNHVGCPAKVEAYRSSPYPQIDVIPDIQYRLKAGGYTDPFIVRSVPVEYPQFGNVTITGPLRKGDQVYLSVSDRSTVEWKKNSFNSGSKPVSARKFNINDVVARVITFSPNVIGDTFRLGEDSAQGMAIEIDSGRIRIGTQGTDIISVLSDTLSFIQGIAYNIGTGQVDSPLGVPVATSPKLLNLIAQINSIKR
jgi:hypothetical protein